LKKSERKTLGAFYTPADVAETVSRWALADGAASVLDPSCGDGAFLIASQVVAAERGPRSAGLRVLGVDLNAAAVIEARSRTGLSQNAVVVADFLELDLPSAGWEPPDAIVGNPPYVRHQLIGASRASYSAAVAEAGCAISGRAGLWAYFVQRSAEMIASGGRLALLVPEAIHQTEYGRNLLEWLRVRFGAVRLIGITDRLFSGTDERVFILLCEGSGPGEIALEGMVAARNLDSAMLTLDGIVERSRGLDPVFSRGPEELHRLLRGVLLASTAHTIGELFDVRIGVVTGANRQFVLDRQRMQALGVAGNQVVPAVSAARQLRGLAYSTGDHAAMEHGGQRVNLVVIQAGAEPPARWLSESQREGADRTSHGRRRPSWFRLNPGIEPDFFATACHHTSPRIVANDANAVCTNALYALTWKTPSPNGLGSTSVAACFLNSATALYAEYSGRTYGGGVLKLEPSDLRRLPVPLTEFDSGTLGDVDQLMRAGDEAGARRLVDEVLLRDAMELPPDTIERIQRALDEARAERMIRRSDS
jgi:tRNA1(Val) A37 N6-methylase TrmN6